MMLITLGFDVKICITCCLTFLSFLKRRPNHENEFQEIKNGSAMVSNPLKIIFQADFFKGSKKMVFSITFSLINLWS